MVIPFPGGKKHECFACLGKCMFFVSITKAEADAEGEAEAESKARAKEIKRIIKINIKNNRTNSTKEIEVKSNQARM